MDGTVAKRRTLAPQRRREISDQLARSGMVETRRLAGEFGVSINTIRRDLVQLGAVGGVSLVSGGAMTTRRQPSAGAAVTDDMARAIEDFVRPGHSIGLSTTGSTAVVLDALAVVPGLTVITNSLAVARGISREDANARGWTLVMIGGAIDAQGLVTGPTAVGTVATLRLDVLILEVAYVKDARSIFAASIEQSEVDSAFNAAADITIIIENADPRRPTAGVRRVLLDAEPHAVIAYGDGASLRLGSLAAREA